MLKYSLSNDVVIKFEATAHRLGTGKAQKVFARALNHTGRKTFTAQKRAIKKQTSIKAGEISRAMRFYPARPNNLQTIVSGNRKFFGLNYFGARQFGYGVRAKVWGEAKRFPSAFKVASINGRVFKRTSATRLPIKQLYGPSISTEMLKDEAIMTFDRGYDQLLPRVTHEISYLLSKR